MTKKEQEAYRKGQESMRRRMLGAIRDCSIIRIVDPFMKNTDQVLKEKFSILKMREKRKG